MVAYITGKGAITEAPQVFCPSAAPRHIEYLPVQDLHPIACLIKDVPVLIIAGEEDRFFAKAEGKSLAEAISGSRFVILPKTGHLSPRESPELVNAEIDKFLPALQFMGRLSNHQERCMMRLSSLKWTYSITCSKKPLMAINQLIFNNFSAAGY